MLTSMVNGLVLEANVSLKQIGVFNQNISTMNETNSNITGAMTPEKLKVLYEAYRAREVDHLTLYKSVAYVLGTIIVLSNLTVVISSGLILRKGQQPKSTYLLLGNVSLADTIIGLTMIIDATAHRVVASDAMCLFQVGMFVCPTMVSIFSVGFIAIDRYIYITHGLYYQRWINTTRVRIGILIIWLVGLILGFMPATRWVNQELKGNQSPNCAYISVFPGGLILINSTLSVIPIAVVAVLYVKILILALRNLTNIKNKFNGSDNINYSVKLPVKNGRTIQGSNSMSNLPHIKKTEDNNMLPNNVKSNGIEELHYSDDRIVTDVTLESKQNNQTNIDSKLSILTIDSDYNNGSNKNESSTSPKPPPSKLKQILMCNRETKTMSKDPRKLRAIVIVMLTSGSFIVTWLPYFIAVGFYVFCTNKIGNPKCISLNDLLRGPLLTMGFLNSILNPLIYAWWHKGFKSALKSYFKQHCCKQN